jgi:phosphoglycolate phosphatase-like HAD superfamily hydrolase
VADEHDEGAPVAILFDVDGCLISTGGAGTRSWRRAVEALDRIPAIGEFTEAGMTDPDKVLSAMRFGFGGHAERTDAARPR